MYAKLYICIKEVVRWIEVGQLKQHAQSSMLTMAGPVAWWPLATKGRLKGHQDSMLGHFRPRIFCLNETPWLYKIYKIIYFVHYNILNLVSIFNQVNRNNAGYKTTIENVRTSSMTTSKCYDGYMYLEN